MRKLYFLMLLFTGLTGFAFSPPVIQTPTDVTTCSGYVFPLHSKDPEILGALNPSLYTVNYYSSNGDANSNVNPIPNPDTFIPNFTQIIFVRVEDNANPTIDYSVTSFVITVETITTGTILTPNQTVCADNVSFITFQGSGGIAPYTFTYAINGGANQTITSSPSGDAVFTLPQVSGVFDIFLISVQSSMGGNCSQILSNLVQINVIPAPVTNPPVDLFVEDIPFDGSAVFDLTSNDALIINGQPGITVYYYETLIDAQVEANVIFPALNYTGTNGQMIWARAENGMGCSVIHSFRLFVTNPNIVFIPDANFKAKLITLGVDTNADGEIQYSEAEAVTNLNVNHSFITDLTGIEAFINLTYLNFSDNQLTTFDPFCLTGMTGLTQLYLSNCQINDLYVNNLTQLTNLEFQNNNITNIDVSNLVNLLSFASSSNPLTSLNISNLVNLTSLKCAVNNLTSLDLTPFPNLTLLQCGANPINSLDLLSLNLAYLSCQSTNITSLDVSNCTSMIGLNFSYNFSLQNLILKNGSNENLNNNSFNDCPALQYICVDDSELNQIQNILLGNNLTNINLNTYCDFTPGGNYNTITGSLIFDGNNNGCDTSDSTFANIRVNMTQWGNNNATFSNGSGNYTFYTTFADQSVSPQFENATFFNVSPQDPTVSFVDNNNNTATQNFCITPNGAHPDLEVVIAPIVPARPGFNATYKVVYKNKGNQTMSGNIGLTYNDNVLDFVSSEVAPGTQTPGLLNYDVINIAPFENRSFYVIFHVNPPTDITNPVNIGDILSFTTVISSMAGDQNPADNTFQYNQTVIGSYDPNDITCLEGTIAPPSEIGNYLHYIINFENTGNADAINIVVKDVIDTAKFDVNSLQILNSSDPVFANIKDNTAEFVFQNINLHSGGHGNILLKVRTKNTLVQGDTAGKRADIFFDYNFPIDTGFANTVFQALNNPHFDLDNTINVYPNPTKDQITIKGGFTFKSVQLYDVQGRLLQTKIIDGNNVLLDLSSHQNGIYFVKVISDKGIKVEKISKE